MITWATQLYQFYTSLQPPQPLPNSVEWLHPQQGNDVRGVLQDFLYKFYNDGNERHLILGINPGRFGAGITGINFTAPKQLTETCGIQHAFTMHSELSAEFIYAVINAYGGAKTFYSKFFIGAVCPLGLVKQKKNINYYDDKELQAVIEPFIVTTIQQQLYMRVNTSCCFCIGGDKNYGFLTALNQKYHWFKKIVPLPHPRFIMQYKRKELPAFISLYLSALKNL